MIIYHVHPIRSYPYLLKKLKPNFNVPYELHSPYMPVNSRDETSALELGVLIHKLKDKVPRQVQYSPDVDNCSYKTNGRNGKKYVDFCYGVFSKNRLVNTENDFLFTIIKHPVQRVYDIFHYLEYEVARSPGFFIRRNTFIDIARKYIEKGLEYFIDEYISNNGVISFKHKEIAYRNIDEITRYKNMPHYNFVGIEKYLKPSLYILSKYTGVPISWEGDITKPSSIVKEGSYRRKDLEELLETDLNYYKVYKKEFHRHFLSLI